MSRKLPLVCFLLVASVSPGQAAQGPAFDCSKAAGSVEKLICKDESLAALDRKLDVTFKAAVKKLHGVADADSAIGKLKAYQRGWIKGRNECWKSDDLRSCVVDEYRHRIAELQAEYLLLKVSKPVFYECNGNPADEIVATFVHSDPPSVRLERGDTTAIGILSKSGSGSRYDADFGIVFWIKGNEARTEWPQGNAFNCRVRK